MNPFGIIGSGAYGTAIAHALSLNPQNQSIFMWARNSDIVNEINSKNTNSKYLGETQLSVKISALNNLDELYQNCQSIIYACPSSHFYTFIKENKTSIKQHQLINTAKGIDPKSFLFHHEIIKRELGSSFLINNYFALSGPSFAKEIAAENPTCVTLSGCVDKKTKELQSLMSHKNFRIYTLNDFIGLQLGGALKNVIAIAVGICEGLQLGFNAQSALINWDLKEITRLGLKMGGKPETFIGLSVIGDLILTCTGSLSRNRQFGIHLGSGLSKNEAIKKVNSTIEGINTSLACHHVLKKNNIHLSILEETYKIIHEDKSPREALETLLDKSLGPDWVN